MTSLTHRQAVAATFRDAVDTFGAAIDAAADLLQEIDPDLHERLDAYRIGSVLDDTKLGGLTITAWLTEMSVALDGRDLLDRPVPDRT